MNSENPSGMSQNPPEPTVGSPYLPPQSMDPGIPEKWRRPSIRERGLLIWILVFSILGIFTVNTDSGDAYSGAQDGVRDAMHGTFYNNGWDAELDASLSRTALEVIETESGVMVYAIVTNEGVRAQSLYDIVVDGVPEGITPEYITGPVSILGGEVRVLAVLLPEKMELSDVELERLVFREAKTLDWDYVSLDNLLHIDEDVADEFTQAYEPIARQQLEAYLATQ